MAWFLPLLAAGTVGGSIFGLQDYMSSDAESAGLSPEQLLQYEQLQTVQAQAVAVPWYKEPIILIGGGAILALIIAGGMYKK